MARSERVVGAAENVDMRGPSKPEPYEVDVDERRVVSAYCCTCEATTTMLLEVGDDSPWEHDEKHASHVVDYWREA
ncbi:hypothetical protein EXE51_15760 [Halorubrum sp. CGM5_25_10-8B]|uniref:hypothetical protein n=1 Tax=Halorubrum sp. CGM5_25_10-8B TaxID=2518115 RepID=UPI0010F847E8|nr:hypothetical protein [Halorubrum sp. CGM5_25_10-8B]TKX35130.1 hypothetical protein EXE51_15760 [Halorubrum sp. CGM5_25_10-8B]